MIRIGAIARREARTEQLPKEAALLVCVFVRACALCANVCQKALTAWITILKRRETETAGVRDDALSLGLIR